MSTLGSIKALQEGLGGIRDVLLDGNSRSIAHLSSGRSLIPASARRKHFHRSEPAICDEAFGMVLIAVLAYGPAIARGVYPPRCQSGCARQSVRSA